MLPYLICVHRISHIDCSTPENAVGLAPRRKMQFVKAILSFLGGIGVLQTEEQLRRSLKGPANNVAIRRTEISHDDQLKGQEIAKYITL